MAQTAIDATRSSVILNAHLPTGAAGVPSAFTAINAGAMKLKLTSTASTGSASGTEITGTGYTTGGTAFSTQSTASSAGSNVTMPGGAGTISWTNGSGGAWNIVSLEITDAAPIRVWYGNWNGQPVVVANGNTFQVAAGAISAGGF
jgi:hypothetical protein